VASSGLRGLLYSARCDFTGDRAYASTCTARDFSLFIVKNASVTVYLLAQFNVVCFY